MHECLRRLNTHPHRPHLVPSADCWHQLVSVWISLRFPCPAPAAGSDVIQSGDDDKQPVTCRCQMQDGRYPNNPPWLVSSSASLFHTSCEELVCPWIRFHSSPVKPKGRPGILSFDPGLKGAPVLELRSHDWLFPLLRCWVSVGTPPHFHLCF